MAGDDDGEEGIMATTAPTTGKVRLELRKTTVKKKRRIDNNNRTDDTNNNQSVVAAFFGAEVKGEGDPATDPLLSHGVVPQEPLVIPVAANKSKFMIRRRSDADAAVDDDERAAQALANDSAMSALQGGSATTRGISIPVASSSSAPNKHNNQDKDVDDDDDMDNKEDRLYQKELQMLPTELTETDDAYDRVPIADFGAALLRGMGWRDDDEGDAKHHQKNIKRGENEEPTALPRPHRLGLGAIPKATEEINHRPLRPDEYDRRQKQRAQHQEFIAQHEKKKLSDPQQTLQDGSIIYLVMVTGDHPDDNDPDDPPRGGERRRRARIVQLRGVPGLNKVQIQYESSSPSAANNDNDGETTTTIVSKSQIDRLVTRSELMDRPFREASPAASPTKKQPVPEPSTSSSSNGKKKRTLPQVISSSSAQKQGKSLKVEEPQRNDDEDDEADNWLIPNIRVRVITKKFGKRYYKAKGIVLDVTRKGATIQMDDDGKLLDRVPTRYVETALPKPGGRCIVVGRKRHWQTKGRLLERHKHTAIIQESENGTALTVPLDDLAEWCGLADEEEGNF
jgi:G patch domain and KOW motifs-containing protein